MTPTKKKESDPRREENARPSEDLPPAGPHGKEELIDRSKTPGTGMLPEPEEDVVDGASG